MLNYGSVALPYEPYISDTLSAATPIELAEYDVAYPETGETKRQSNTRVFDGTENWWASGTAENNFYNHRFGLTLSSRGVKYTIPCISTPYAYNQSVYFDTAQEGGVITDNYNLYLRIASITTVEELKAHLAALAAAGDPLTVTYKTAKATTEATPFDKSKYIAWKNGSETIEQGTNDNSEYGAENTVEQDYFTLTGKFSYSATTPQRML